jgi:hypothetical protein
MKTKRTTLKNSSIGAITAVLLAASAQISAADGSLPIWARQFKEAYQPVHKEGVEAIGATQVVMGPEVE